MRKTIKIHTWIYKNLNPTLEGIVTKRKKRTRTRKRKQKEKRSERKEKKRKWWFDDANIMRRDSSLKKKIYPNKVYEKTSQKKKDWRKVILSL